MKKIFFFENDCNNILDDFTCQKCQHDELFPLSLNFFPIAHSSSRTRKETQQQIVSECCWRRRRVPQQCVVVWILCRRRIAVCTAIPATSSTSSRATSFRLLRLFFNFSLTSPACASATTTNAFLSDAGTWLLYRVLLCVW